MGQFLTEHEVELRLMIILEQPLSEIPNPVGRVHLEFLVESFIVRSQF